MPIMQPDSKSIHCKFPTALTEGRPQEEVSEVATIHRRPLVVPRTGKEGFLAQVWTAL